MYVVFPRLARKDRIRKDMLPQARRAIECGTAYGRVGTASSPTAPGDYRGCRCYLWACAARSKLSWNAASKHWLPGDQLLQRRPHLFLGDPALVAPGHN